MKKAVLLCLLASLTVIPCVSTTSEIKNTQTETAKVEKKENSNSTESILVKRTPKITELEGTWVLEEPAKYAGGDDFQYLSFSGSSIKLKFGKEDKYYIQKGTFSIKKDGSVIINISAECEVTNGVNTRYIQASDFNYITNLPTRRNFGKYSINGNILTFKGVINFTRYTEEIDWRMFK